MRAGYVRPGGEPERFSSSKPVWSLSNLDDWDASALRYGTSPKTTGRCIPQGLAASPTPFNPRKHLKPADGVRRSCGRVRNRCVIPGNVARHEAVHSACTCVRITPNPCRGELVRQTLGVLVLLQRHRQGFHTYTAITLESAGRLVSK